MKLDPITIAEMNELQLARNSHRFGEKYIANNYKESALFNDLGNAHFGQGNFDQAIKAYYSGLEIELMNLEPTHPNIIITLSNISETYRQRGDFELALETYKEVFRLQRKRFGIFHPEPAKTLHVIGLIHEQMGNLPFALKCIKKVILWQRNFKSDEGIQNLSISLTHAGCVYYRMKDIPTAMKFLREALQLKSKCSNTQDMAFILYNIGLCYQTEGSYKQAIQFYTKSLELEIKTLGQDHKDSSATMFKLGEVYSAIGMFDEALFFFRNSLRIGRKLSKNQMDPVTESRILLETGYVHFYQGHTAHLRHILNELALMDRRVGISPSNMKLYRFLQTCKESCGSLAPAA